MAKIGQVSKPVQEVSPAERAIADKIRGQASEAINTVYSKLVETAPRGRLPEYIFTGYFLPVFANLVPLSTVPNIITEWISIAGTPTSEVDILDPSGRVLYTVPALYDDGILNFQRQAGQNFSRIAEEYALRKNHIPILGERYLANALSTKLNTEISETTHESTQRWMAIFQRYGIVPVTQPSGPVPSAPADDNLDDLFDLG